MRIHVGYELIFDCPAPTPMLFMLNIHPSRTKSIIQPDDLRSEPVMAIKNFIDPFGNRCGLGLAPAGRVRLWGDAVVEDDGQPDIVNWGARQHSVLDLPIDTLLFLRGSRYCETDRLVEIAWSMFESEPEGWGRVQAICNWVNWNVRYGYEHASPTRTAWDVYTERTGVCRDFVHLACAFCRCMNIPARYATGYLGDIGIVQQPSPMDFHAWMEVYLDGRWYMFDPRHNTPRIGRILMARGRDAADVPMVTSFGKTTLLSFTVQTSEI